MSARQDDQGQGDGPCSADGRTASARIGVRHGLLASGRERPRRGEERFSRGSGRRRFRKILTVLTLDRNVNGVRQLRHTRCVEKDTVSVGTHPSRHLAHRENAPKNREVDRAGQIIRKNYDCVIRVHRARMPLLPRNPRPLKRGIPCAPQLSRVGPRAPAPGRAWVSTSRESAERVQCTRADGGGELPPRAATRRSPGRAGSPRPAIGGVRSSALG